MADIDNKMTTDASPEISEKKTQALEPVKEDAPEKRVETENPAEKSPVKDETPEKEPEEKNEASSETDKPEPAETQPEDEEKDGKETPDKAEPEASEKKAAEPEKGQKAVTQPDEKTESPKEKSRKTRRMKTEHSHREMADSWEPEKHSHRSGKDTAPRRRALTVALLSLLGVVLLASIAVGIGIFRIVGRTFSESTTTLPFEMQSSLAEQLLQEDLDQQSEEEKSSIAQLEEVREIKKPTFTTAPADAVEEEKNILGNTDEIYNVLLCGLDGGSIENGRTDSMIIVSLNMTQKKIKLVSMMRDTLVAVEGHDLNRLNTINVYVGTDALVKAVEDYYGIPIDGYVKVSFSSTARIIDTLGGVPMWISDKEAAEINGAQGTSLAEGSCMLSGKLAVQYMRIRHASGGEFGRTERQRKVIATLLKRCRSMDFGDAMALVSEVIPNIRTGYDVATVTEYAKRVFELRNAEFSTLRLPMDGHYEAGRYKGMYVLNVDFEANGAAARDFIYGSGTLAGDQIQVLNEAAGE